MMNICFFGVGGVGGYLGALVAEHYGNEHQIYFMARGSHKDAICKDGLLLKKAGGEQLITARPKLCTSNVDELPVCDVIVLSVKAYDLERACKDIAKIAHANTLILPLLNGVDIYDRIRGFLSLGIVFPACIYVGTHIESPGVIYQKGGSCKIVFGADPQRPDFNPEILLSLFSESKIEISFEDDIQVAIWSKYLFIASFGLVGAAYHKTLGEIIESPDLSFTIKNVMSEIGCVAKQSGIELDQDIVEGTYQKAKQFPYETKTSFQRDIESKGTTNEGDIFGGTLIRLGKKLGVDVTTIEKVDTMLNSALIH